MPGTRCFPRRQRLAAAKEISEVFDFNVKYHSAHFSILARPNGLDFSRIAIMAPKKIEKAAARRNYMRRVVREYFRTHILSGLGLDLVFKIKTSFNYPDHEIITRELDGIFKKLLKCPASL